MYKFHLSKRWLRASGEYLRNIWKGDPGLFKSSCSWEPIWTIQSYWQVNLSEKFKLHNSKDLTNNLQKFFLLKSQLSTDNVLSRKTELWTKCIKIIQQPGSVEILQPQFVRIKMYKKLFCNLKLLAPTLENIWVPVPGIPCGSAGTAWTLDITITIIINMTDAIIITMIDTITIIIFDCGVEPCIDHQVKKQSRLLKACWPRHLLKSKSFIRENRHQPGDFSWKDFHLGEQGQVKFLRLQVGDEMWRKLGGAAGTLLQQRDAFVQQVPSVAIIGSATRCSQHYISSEHMYHKIWLAQTGAHPLISA